MHGDALEYGEDAEGVHRDLAALVMRAIPGGHRRARRMQPYVHRCLISSMCTTDAVLSATAIRLTAQGSV